MKSNILPDRICLALPFPTLFLLSNNETDERKWEGHEKKEMLDK